MSMTTQTFTLTDFLLARIAEDERWVQEWESHRSDPMLAAAIAAQDGRYWYTAEDLFDDSPMLDWDEAEHIAAWSPARVLAECEAKRRIVAEHPAPDYIGTPGARLACERCSDLGGPYGYDDEENWIDWPCPTLRALASIYADHPDYREEWRP